MMTFIEDSETIFIEGPVLEFLTTYRLNHTNRAIIFASIDLSFGTLNNANPNAWKKRLHLPLPLIHKKLLINYYKESATEAGRNTQRHKGLSLSAGHTN